MSNIQQITIIVDANGIGSIDREIVRVTNTDTLLQFNLVAIGYAFPAANAVIVADPDAPFYGSWTTSPYEAALVDRRTPPYGVYYYGVNVLNTITNETRPLQFGSGVQPRINNNNE